MLDTASPLLEAGPPQADNTRRLAALCEDYLVQSVFYVTDGDEPCLSVPVAPPNEGRLPVKSLYRGEVHTMLVQVRPSLAVIPFVIYAYIVHTICVLVKPLGHVASNAVRLEVR